MFSGIIETTIKIKFALQRADQLEIFFDREDILNDIKIGDSVAHDGICLTVHSLTPNQVSYVLGIETLRITSWNFKNIQNKIFNIEKSMKLGDRLHGHIVTGHVDCFAKVQNLIIEGDNWTLTFEVEKSFAPMIWKKGSIAVNGVSLTVNKAVENTFEVGLIPETLRRTNLSQLKVGDLVNIEVDQMARGLFRFLENYFETHPVDAIKILSSMKEMK